MNKKINLIYFASLRDTTGMSSETIDTSLNTLTDLWCFLKEKYSIPLSTDLIRVAINDEYKELNSNFNNNDNIVFIPPVAGG